jgi:AcrR family transcriptional regulator
VKNDEAVLKRPPKAERDALRRDEIAAAAKACFVRDGFHGASMSQIATEAQMSVGQIYRYFANKEAIVHAIVERIVAKRMAYLPRSNLGKMAQILAHREFDRVSEEEKSDHNLMLEVAAEAMRNPEVAAVLRDSDRRWQAAAVKHVRSQHPGLSEAEAQARVEFMAVLFDGTAFRHSTAGIARPKLLAELFRQAMEEAVGTGVDPTGVHRKRADR